MGISKARLRFGDRPLLALLVDRLAAAFDEVLVVAAREQDLPGTPARVVYDEVPDQGPLAGLEAGLKAAAAPLAFVASCDVPFLNPAVARYLVEAAEGYEAVVPEWEGRLHPLQAVYRTSVHTRVREELEAGRRRMTDFVGLLRTRRIPEAELRAIDPKGLSFMNVNSPEDYQRALALWDTLRPGMWGTSTSPAPP